MFSKPINLVLVYIVTVFNLSILLSPVLILAIPFVKFKNHTLILEPGLLSKIYAAVIFLLFLVSFLMLCYLVVDFIFGFSVAMSLKGCRRYEKIKNYDFLTDVFDQVKNKFGEKSVRLYIKDSNEINAFAVSSLGNKSIILTKGLINHYLVEFTDPKTFLYALRSLLGHEMSHLINKDFLPTFLIITNQKMTNLVSKLLHLIFRISARAVSMMPYGIRISNTMWRLYSLLNWFLTSFNRLVVYNLYEFLRRFISRSIEYRCDRQSALAFGGQNMVLALSRLGEGGYFTLFSTHPGTKARMKRVAEIKSLDSVIKPRIIDDIANYFALMFLAIICLYFAKLSGVDLLVRDFIYHHEVFHRKLSSLWRLIKQIY